MKLHFTYNLQDLNQALAVAEQTAEHADILGVGSLLLFKEGIKAVKSFKATFPQKEIFAETRITEKGDDVVEMMARAGANYVSILAGTFNNTIKKTVVAAKNFDVKVALDLLDSPSLGQSAMDAKTLGVSLLILHRHYGQNESADLENDWHNVRENTSLPIFITGKIDESSLEHALNLKPQGIMIGGSVSKADNPNKAAQLFKSRIG